MPDSHLFPTDAVRRVLNEVVRDEGDALLQYYPVGGYAPLRQYLATYLLRFGIAGELIASPVQFGRHVLEKLAVSLPIEKIGWGGGISLTASICFPDQNQPIGVREWKPPEEDGLDDCEDRGGRSNTDREGQHRYGGKAWMFAQRTATVPDVLRQCLQHPATTNFVGEISYLRDAAEIAVRRVACRLWRHAPLDEGFCLQFNVSAQLVVDIVNDGVAAHQRPQPGHDNVEPLHPTALYVACRTLAMAMASRSQLSSSIRSCVRPARVSA